MTRLIAIVPAIVVIALYGSRERRGCSYSARSF